MQKFYFCKCECVQKNASLNFCTPDVSKEGTKERITSPADISRQFGF
ncbi:Uncharacterized protein dnm_012920 [Desulfonema magnum]|uniref:Uncharacterized protein n=1 Tax=Desulfonema magnum TaxID=45655 RepID=A0A975GL08_9BACT|nr:Uncharacterized protein dnm_012920 [Desulfonema magnum]